MKIYVDMNALQAIAEISHRETISIERIRRMNCVVHRTLITKLERKFHNNDLKFLTPHPLEIQRFLFVNKGRIFPVDN